MRFAAHSTIVSFLFIVAFGNPAKGQMFPPDPTVTIGTAENPVVTPFVPPENPWIKQIGQPVDEGPWADDQYDPEADPADQGLLSTIFLQEWVEVGEGPDWTDWHEEIVDSPGWVWAHGQVQVDGMNLQSPFLEVQLPSEEVFNPPESLQVDATGTTVDFTFFDDPLPEGTTVRVLKELVYVGPTPSFNDGETYSGALTIHEYPTPEPTTLSLLAVGGLMVIRSRRRV